MRSNFSDSTLVLKSAEPDLFIHSVKSIKAPKLTHTWLMIYTQDRYVAGR